MIEFNKNVLFRMFNKLTDAPENPTGNRFILIALLQSHGTLFTIQRIQANIWKNAFKTFKKYVREI